MMLEPTPLRNLHEEYAANLRQVLRAEGMRFEQAMVDSAVEFVPFGPSEGGPAIDIVATYGMVEAEYAAIRRGAGILDRAQRAVIRVRGTDRRDFLNRLLTQQLKDPAPGQVSRSFWLNRKGRIEADLLVIEREDETLLDLDFHQRDTTIATLQSFLFSEDVEIAAGEDCGRLAIHGPRAAEALAAAFECDEPIAGAPCGSTSIWSGSSFSLAIARNDEMGETGYELFLPRAALAGAWRLLVESDGELSQGKRRVRPIGWHAYNIARIEAGTPLMNIDFGPTNLPHETGIVNERISFTKGCYLGQEIVARMEHLGKPKQVLAGLRVESDHLPVAGAQVFSDEHGSAGDQVGIVTSSTLSPMLGAVPIAFAMVRTTHSEPRTSLWVNAEGAQVEAIVHALRFLPE